MRRKYHLMIFLVAIVSGSLLLYYGIKTQNSGLTGLGTILLGLAMGIMGLDDLVYRESVENHEDGSTSTYSGMSAVLLGLFWLIIAIVLVLSGIVILLGQHD